MAGGINIKFISDVSNLLRGTKDVQSAFADVVDSVEDVATEATKAGGTTTAAFKDAGDKIGQHVDDGTTTASGSLKDLASDADTQASATGDAFKTAGDDIGIHIDSGTSDATSSLDDVADKADSVRSDVDTATGKMEQSFKDAFDKVHTDTSSKLSQVATDAEHTGHRAAEGLDEIKDSAKSNATETAASFDGSFDSISDGVQGTVAEFLQGFGPAGTIAGLAIAGGIGLLKKAFDDQSEAAQADAQAMAEAYKAAIDDMIASGEDFVSDSFVNDQIKSIVEDDKKLKAAQDQAKQSGASLSDVLRGQSGDLDALGRVHDAYQRKIDAEKAAIDGIKDTLTTRTDLSNDQREALIEEIGEHENLVDQLKGEQKAVDTVGDSYKKSGTKADIYRQSVKTSKDAVRDAQQAERDYADKLEDTGSQIADNTKKIKDKTDRDRANKSAINDLVDAGEDWIQKLKDTNASSKDVSAAQKKLRDDVEAAGRKMGLSKDQAKKYADQILDIPKTRKTTVTLDKKTAQHQIDSFITTNDGRRIRVKIDATRGKTYQAAPGAPLAFADGGLIPGLPSSSDNGYAKMASGEFVVNAAATSKNLSLLEAINQGRNLPTTGGGATSVSLAGAKLVVQIGAREFEGYMAETAAAVVQAHTAAQDRAAAYVGGGF
ncbi:hypothetical protein GCM10023221_04250 [Luteimicrobium xylanilyticum]|uniref:Uncharacterized protein n=1 Tax=Luteimicrobium xylanilyticum TaxID=1133546 RepID=A0A5P9Q897_9MICO|nr:hypothetical protein [Luteimicrobium xylanilyticum]QFU97282.1 hypothetical protein KDY119_00776 [Luteimicrobium xylanilyticum]